MLDPDFGAHRYTCIALMEAGHFATGNPADSVEHALGLVHWYKLDQPPEARGNWSYFR